MNLQKYKEAAALVSQIEKVDIDIADIEKLGMLVATGETKSSFRMEVLDETPEQEKVTVSKDGEMEFKRGGTVQGNRPRMWFDDIVHLHNSEKIFSADISQSKSKTGYNLAQALNGKATVKILSFILYEKRLEREALIEKLNQLKPL